MFKILILDNSLRSFNNFRGEAFNFLEQKGFCKYDIIAPSSNVSKIRSILIFLKLLLKKRYDSIILISIFSITITPIIYLINKNITILLPGLGRLFRSRDTKFYYPFLRKYVRFCVKISKNVIVLSKSDESVLAVNKNIVVIASEGIDLNLYKKKCNISKIKNISFVGRPIHDKGFEEFLNLIELDTNKDFSFHFYGDGFEDKLLENRFQKLVRNHNNFVDHGYTDKRKIWSNTDLLFFPSIYGEGFPFVVLEALASGCIVYLKPSHWTEHLPINMRILYSQDDKNHYDLIKGFEVDCNAENYDEIYSYLKLNHDLYSNICPMWVEVLSNE